MVPRQRKRGQQGLKKLTGVQAKLHPNVVEAVGVVVVGSYVDCIAVYAQNLNTGKDR